MKIINWCGLSKRNCNIKRNVLISFLHMYMNHSKFGISRRYSSRISRHKHERFYSIGKSLLMRELRDGFLGAIRIHPQLNENFLHCEKCGKTFIEKKLLDCGPHTLCYTCKHEYETKKRLLDESFFNM